MEQWDRTICRALSYMHQFVHHAEWHSHDGGKICLLILGIAIYIRMA